MLRSSRRTFRGNGQRNTIDKGPAQKKIRGNIKKVSRGKKRDPNKVYRTLQGEFTEAEILTCDHNLGKIPNRKIGSG